MNRQISFNYIIPRLGSLYELAGLREEVLYKNDIYPPLFYFGGFMEDWDDDE